MNAALSEATAAVIPPREQRVGRAFLAHGAAVRAAHLAYWAGHPRAVAAIERNRDRIDKFIEGASFRECTIVIAKLKQMQLLYLQSKVRLRPASCTS